MSAGTGIVHAEANPSATESMRLIQLWLLPRHRDNTPRWEQKPFTKEQGRNRLLAVVSPTDAPVDGSLTVDQDATIYVSTLDAGREVTHTSKPGRHAYLFVIAGELDVNGQPLKNGDQARVENETELKIRATQNAELILLDLP
jgi:redox-sensitive bicupin YhaK (pirin superfamily)